VNSTYIKMHGATINIVPQYYLVLKFPYAAIYHLLHNSTRSTSFLWPKSFIAG